MGIMPEDRSPVHISEALDELFRVWIVPCTDPACDECEHELHDESERPIHRRCVRQGNGWEVSVEKYGDDADLWTVYVAAHDFDAPPAEAVRLAEAIRDCAADAARMNAA